jgi:LPS-assembly protein
MDLMLNWQEFITLYLLRVMRYRFNYPFILVLLCFAQYSYAGEDLPDSRNDNNPQTLAQSGQEGPAVIEADKMAGKSKDQIEASGDATLRQGGESIRADTLLFNQNTHEVDAQGGVILEQGGNTLSGPHLMLNMDTGVGKMERPQFYIKENNARGAADMLNILDRQHYSLNDATYTTCPAGNQDWQMKMGLLEIDRDRQVGVAHSALVEFKGVPILYSPWMDFPLSNQRKSGFLAPIFGGTSSGGSEITLPFYWNIAPNFDATLAPREMTKRGLMLNNEFRYLEPGFHGEMHIDVLPNDAIAKSTRALFSLNHEQTLTNRLSGYVNYTRVKDNDYFRDLGDAVNATSQSNLLQEGGLHFDAGWWTAMARVQNYQTLQDPAAPIAVPYTRLPQLTLNASQNYAGANASFAGEYVNFSHPTAVNATRLVLYPSVSYPLVNQPAYFVTPKVSVHSAYYAMGANNTGALPNASSTLPIVSLDSGVAFEREGNMFNSDYVQTLEPRAFYVYVPYKDQSQLPNFDSAQADFSITQMFMENRFFGNDRIGDANQLTLALTSRLLEPGNGMEHLKMMIGERISFSTPQVNLITPASSTNKSDILLALSGRVTRHWSLDSEFQFDPNQSHVQRYNITAGYRPESGNVLNLGYRFTRNTLRQVDISTQLPLMGRWHAVARWNYSLQDSSILEAIGGLEYNQDCWMLRLVAQRFATATQQSNTSFFIQLELNDFVKVGSDPLSLLKQSIPGYTKLNEKPTTQPPQVIPAN